MERRLAAVLAADVVGYSRLMGRLGRIDEARPHLDEVTRQRPDFSLAFVRHGYLFSDSRDFEHYLDGLGKVYPVN